MFIEDYLCLAEGPLCQRGLAVGTHAFILSARAPHSIMNKIMYKHTFRDKCGIIMVERFPLIVVVYILAVSGIFALSYLIIDRSLFESCLVTWIVGALVGWLGVKWSESNVGAN